MSDLDKAIRAELARDYWRLSRHSSTAADKGATAVLTLLDWAAALEADSVSGSNQIVRTLTRQVRVILADSLGVSGEDLSEPTPAPQPYPVELFPGCPCKACVPVGADPFSFAAQMHLCPKCGNKRCPGAANHNRTCTESNKPGQPGSLYERPAPNPTRCTGCNSADEFWCSCPDGYTPPAEVVTPEGTP